jgi:hypothetical protein
MVVAKDGGGLPANEDGRHTGSDDDAPVGALVSDSGGEWHG